MRVLILKRWHKSIFMKQNVEKIIWNILWKSCIAPLIPFYLVVSSVPLALIKIMFYIYTNCNHTKSSTNLGWSLTWRVLGLWPQSCLVGLCPRTPLFLLLQSYLVIKFPAKITGNCALLLSKIRNSFHPGKRRKWGKLPQNKTNQSISM